MARIVWDASGERLYETGVDRGVLYPMGAGGTYPLGVPWNGLTGITESPSGAEAKPLFADNIKYLNMISAEEFGLTIEAFTYPDEFALCDGSVAPAVGLMLQQQERKLFGLCYRTLVGDDVDGQSHGYKLHLVYGCLASPSEKGYVTVNDSPEAINFSWEVKTTPVVVTGYKPTSVLVVDSTLANAGDLAALEDMLYGDAANPAELPLPDEIITLFTTP